MSPKLMQLFSEIAWLNEQHRMVLRHGWELDLRVQDAMLRTKGNIRPTGASFKAIKVHTASDKVHPKPQGRRRAPPSLPWHLSCENLSNGWKRKASDRRNFNGQGDLRGVLDR